MKRYIQILLCLFPLVSTAQLKKEKSLELGNRAFSEMQYSYAIAYYKAYLNKFPADTMVLARVGHCYRINNVYDSAIVYYTRNKLQGGFNGNALAELYANTGNYQKAVGEYNELLRTESLDKKTAALYQERRSGFLQQIFFLRDSLDYDVKYLPINTPYNEYGAVSYQGGLVFESNRQQRINNRNEYGWDGLSFSKLYYLRDTSGIWKDTTVQRSPWSDKRLKRSLVDYSSESINDNSKFNSRFSFRKLETGKTAIPIFNRAIDIDNNYGAISFSSDGLNAYYSRNAGNTKGTSLLEIWEVVLENGKWGRPRRMKLNQSGYSYFHPAISPDGTRLYYVSDQPDGYGGTDIYYMEKTENGLWGESVNAGPVINTAANELFPTFSEGNFYFSSNGHAGLGGLDIFQYMEHTKGKKAGVKNLGYPINTRADDMAYSGHNGKGYFSSNRYGSDDLFGYQFLEAKIEVQGKVSLNSNTSKTLVVKLIDRETGLLTDSSRTDVQGQYVVKARPGREYRLQIEDGSGHGFTQEIKTDDYTAVQPGVEERGNPVNLGKENKGLSNKANQYRKLLNPVDLLIPASPTDTSKQNNDSNSASERKNGPVQDQLQKNREGVLGPVQAGKQHVVYFGLNRTNLGREHRKALDLLADQLRADTGLYAVLGSFTDCSGSISYNLKLSARRSQSVKRYLLGKGIPKNRIRASYYGKKYLIKACEEKYSVKKQLVNRRTEVFLSRDPKDNWLTIHRGLSAMKVVDAPVKAANPVSDLLRKKDSLVLIQQKQREIKERMKKAKQDSVAFLRLQQARTKDSIANLLQIQRAAEQKRELAKKDSLRLIRLEQIRKKDSVTKVMQIQNAAEQRKDSATKAAVSKPIVAVDVRDMATEDSISQRELVAALDSLAKLKREQERIVEYLTKRFNKKPINVYVASDSVDVEIWDSGIHDGDSVSVVYNKRIIVDRKELKVNSPIRFKLRVDKDERKNEMVIVAENLGSEPPNTAVMIIREKSGKRHEVMLNTDLTHNEVVYFIRISPTPPATKN